MMKINLMIFLMAATTHCAVMSSEAKVIHEDKGIITLGYYTGSQLEKGYDAAFIHGALKVCQGGEYKVLERSFTPSTLKANKDVPSSRYHWVIECRGI